MKRIISDTKRPVKIWASDLEMVNKLKSESSKRKEALLKIQVRVDDGGYEHHQHAISELVKQALFGDSNGSVGME